jgi:hypothetical protein
MVGSKGGDWRGVGVTEGVIEAVLVGVGVRNPDGVRAGETRGVGVGGGMGVAGIGVRVAVCRTCAVRAFSR